MTASSAMVVRRTASEVRSLVLLWACLVTEWVLPLRYRRQQQHEAGFLVVFARCKRRGHYGINSFWSSSTSSSRAPVAAMDLWGLGCSDLQRLSVCFRWSWPLYRSHVGEALCCLPRVTPQWSVRCARRLQNQVGSVDLMKDAIMFSVYRCRSVYVRRGVWVLLCT